MEPLQTIVTVNPNYGRGIPNITFQNCRFYGKPNFSGVPNQWKDDRRQFTILVPMNVLEMRKGTDENGKVVDVPWTEADMLREIGYNVKTKVLTKEEKEQGLEPLSHISVKVDFRPDRENPGDMSKERGPDIYIVQEGKEPEKLTSKTVACLDNARFQNIDMEIRGWEYAPEENPGQYSARLVSLVAVMRPSTLGEKYGLRI